MKEIIRFYAAAHNKASISKKATIVDGIAAATNINRKSVIKALRREHMTDSKLTKRHGRPLRYISEVDVALASLLTS